MEVPSRIVHLPLSWNDEAMQPTIDKYMQRLRADAPWCPSNIEFIRRINGLDSIDEVKRIVFDASYLVLGLGDVYLGAPVATPVDPRHRLVTTKYNPARTWTPENVVGIGGAYLCVYGMEGPGGYQLFGRTCQMWNTYRVTDAFEPGKPWLLRFFDQIRFYPVSGEELSRLPRGFLEGKRHDRDRAGTFRLGDYRALPRRATPRASPPSRRASRRPSTTSARAGKRRVRTRAAAAGEMRRASRRDDGAAARRNRGRESRCPAACGRSWSSPGSEVSRRRDPGHRRDHEDGDRGLRAVERRGARAALRRGRAVALGQALVDRGGGGA